MVYQAVVESGIADIEGTATSTEAVVVLNTAALEVHATESLPRRGSAHPIRVGRPDLYRATACLRPGRPDSQARQGRTSKAGEGNLERLPPRYPPGYLFGQRIEIEPQAWQT